MLSMIINQCTDELETRIAEGSGDVSVPDRIKDKMEEIFGLKEEAFEKISLHEFILDRLRGLGPRFAHREMDIQTQLEVGPPIRIPRAVLQKIFDGLLKNAIENTPDESRIEVVVQKRPLGMEMVVKDYGVGISEENQRRIFEGFFPTQETMTYCSMRPLCTLHLVEAPVHLVEFLHRVIVGLRDFPSQGIRLSSGCTTRARASGHICLLLPAGSLHVHQFRLDGASTKKNRHDKCRGKNWFKTHLST